MAAFAIDGGDIFIGVGERDGGFQIAPLPLDGLPERVEEIAQARVDPPLLVETQAIQGDCDPSHGVLWIAVPPSSQAPHQVGGRYYERGDKQSRIMSDAAVERLIRARRRTLAGINSKLEAQIEHDERRAGRRSRVFGAAEPIGAAGDELYRAVGGSAPERWSEFKGVLLSEAGRLEPRRGAEEFLKADSRIRIAVGPNRHVFRREYGDTGPIVAVSDSGAIESPSRVVEPQMPLVLSLQVIVDSCLDMIIAMRAVARQTGRRWSWDIGLGVSGAQSEPVQFLPDSSYVRARRVNCLELMEQPWEIVDRQGH